MSSIKVIKFSKTSGQPVSQDIQQRCIDRIIECHHILGYPKKLPTLSFDLRGRTAGQAYLGQNHIRLNGQLVNENTDHFIEQTVAHELAHLSAHDKFGPKISAHGSEWKHMMHLLKIPSDRCHTYKTTSARGYAKKLPRVVPRIILRPPIVFIPKGLPVSDTMWAYTQKQALKRHLSIPNELRHNKILLIQWIERLMRPH